VKRREFITLLGGTAAWPLAARAQQPDGMRRIGMLLALAEDDPEIRARLAVFRQGLEKRGWSEGRNVRIDYRFAPPPVRCRVRRSRCVAVPNSLLGAVTPRQPQESQSISQFFQLLLPAVVIARPWLVGDSKRRGFLMSLGFATSSCSPSSPQARIAINGQRRNQP
jgi:hypothetical protein